MMKLNNAELTRTEVWRKAAIQLPKFDRQAMIKYTHEHPAWVHFGAGNIFRAFPAVLQQMLLDQGLAKSGIIVVEGYDTEIIDRLYQPHDNLSLLVTLKADGSIEKTVIGSIAESLKVDGSTPNDAIRLKEIFIDPDLQIVSFTITEKGYNLVSGNGELLPAVQEDLNTGPASAHSYIGIIAALLLQRYIHGKHPIALVSLDNCSHNGTKLYEAIHTFAYRWTELGLAEKGFSAYIDDPTCVSFTWSMIDKITPRPDSSVERMLEDVGFEDTACIITQKNTYAAPFVNAEEAQYLIIEDHFPNGRPALEKVGVIFTDRSTVDKVEKMKVCTCLNPLHTALAIFGCLLGYTKISDEMKDKDLNKLVEIIGYKEGLPVVVDPLILSPKAFLDEVLQVRFPNPFMPDTPQRIATDTSQKLSIRFGETIKAYLSSEQLDVSRLRLIPFVLAAWCRYLLRIDDNGNFFIVSADPMLESLSHQLDGLSLGQSGPFTDILFPILSNEAIFGIDLIQAGLGELVVNDFTKMMAGPGAIRSALKKHVAD